MTHGLIKQPPNVIFFDAHDDGVAHRNGVSNQVKAFRKARPTIETFWNFTEFELSPLDDDWVTVGMELGLINHAIVIGDGDDHNIPGDNIHVDHTGAKHYFVRISNLWDELGERGSLGDSYLKEPHFSVVREIFQFNNGNYDFRFEDPATPFILDFDLDYFTYDQLGKLKAWPKQRMIDFFFKRVGTSRTNTQEFISELVSRCEVVTICLESEHCGGFSQSSKILKRLFSVVFQQSLD